MNQKTMIRKSTKNKRRKKELTNHQDAALIKQRI